MGLGASAREIVMGLMSGLNVVGTIFGDAFFCSSSNGCDAEKNKKNER
jgi:hypothetical protein